MHAKCPTCSTRFKTASDFGGVETCPQCRHVFDTASAPAGLLDSLTAPDKLTATGQRSPARTLLLTAGIVAIGLAVLAAGVYVLANYGAQIGAFAAFLIALVLSTIGLVLGVIYVLAPLIVVFQLRRLSQQAEQSNRLLGDIANRLSKN